DQADFSFNFKLENMKMFDGDYHVALSKNVIGQFSHASRPLTYWVAMDATSTYKE
ncbi:MAG: DNA polymerase, partial [Betaproteobacteria bacterium]|nr:DNA polymerase [Betaproteobacteria bacterium]